MLPKRLEKSDIKYIMARMTEKSWVKCLIIDFGAANLAVGGKYEPSEYGLRLENLNI